MTRIAVGSPAPDFDLADQAETRHRLKDYAGKWLLIYFYPKDDTPGCTTEACALKENFHALQKAGCAILGISADSRKKHAAFAGKYGLPFPLLADTEKTMITAYGVWRKKKFMGREYMGIARVSFLLGPDQTIVKIYDPVKPDVHAAEVLKDVKAMA